MSQHVPPAGNPGDREARLEVRLAQMQREINELRGAPAINIPNLEGTNLGFQTGKTTVSGAAVPPAFNAFEFTLPVEWKELHLAFLVSLHPAKSNGTWLTNSGPFNGAGAASLSKGLFAFSTPEVQNVDVFWTSIGR